MSALRAESGAIEIAEKLASKLVFESLRKAGQRPIMHKAIQLKAKQHPRSEGVYSAGVAP